MLFILIIALLSFSALGCTLDFAVSASFTQLVGRSGYTVMFAYNPQGKHVESQLSEVLHFASKSREMYATSGADAIYCPHVVLADGVSFEPFQEKVFAKVRQGLNWDEETLTQLTQEKDVGAMHRLQSMGVDIMPSLVVMKGGHIISQWDADLSSTEMLNLLRATVDNDNERSRKYLPTSDDALGEAASATRLFTTTIIMPHFMIPERDLRRDLYAAGGNIIRPTKGTAVSKVLFSDRSLTGQVYVYSVVPLSLNISEVRGITEQVVDAEWVPSQWSRRLKEAGLTLFRGLVTKSDDKMIGSNPNDSRVLASLVLPSVLEGSRHLADLAIAGRRSPCIVTVFLKDVTDDVVVSFRERLAKVAKAVYITTGGERSIGDTCSFMVSDPDVHTRHFTSFGFMFKSLYKSSQDLKGRSSSVPQIRQRYSDNMIGVEYDNRKYTYPEHSFNAPLLTRFLKQVLSGKVVRTRRCEMFDGFGNNIDREPHQMYYPFADCDTLYYEGLRDFRRDSLVVMMPSDMRSCLKCFHTEAGVNCSFNATKCPALSREASIVNGVLSGFTKDARKEVSIFFYVSSENDMSPFLRLPPLTSKETVYFLLMHRSDKQAYIKDHASHQPGVHNLHAMADASTLRVATISLPAGGALKSTISHAIDHVLIFIKEASEALSDYIDIPISVHVGVEGMDVDDDADEF